jgi:hypothetical protein
MNGPVIEQLRGAATHELERHVAAAWLSVGSHATHGGDRNVARVVVLEPVNSNSGGSRAAVRFDPFC